MSSLEAIILGLIQGLTEFLPVSSSGHLAIGKALFGIETADLSFEVAVHAATVLATIVVFWKDILALLRGLFKWQMNSETRYILLIFLSMIPVFIVGMFFWIYLSMNPTFFDVEYTANIPIFIFGITLYVPILILPFSVFKSLDVRIGTNYRDFKLYNGVTATVYRMAVPVFAALILVMREVLLYIGFSAVIILFVVFLTSIIYYYAMEATTSADIAKKWKIFIPVPLLLSLHEEASEKKVYPGTPVRDENDMSDINLAIDKRR